MLQTDTPFSPSRDEMKTMKKLAQLLSVLVVSTWLMTGCAQVQQLQADLVNPGSGSVTDRTLGQALMEDEALEQSMIRALQQAGWKEEVKGITITRTDWEIQHHPISGVPTHRLIPADVVVLYPGKTNCRLFSLSFKQQYDGSAYSSNTELFGTGNSWLVDCEKAVSTDNRATPN